MVKSHIIIRDCSVILNGREIFSQRDTLENFLIHAYERFALAYPKFYKMDSMSKAGFLAAELLLSEQAANVYQPYQLGLVLSNNHSSLDTDKKYLESTRSMASPALFVYTLPNIVAGEICIRHKIKGENAFFVTERFDAGLLTGYTDMLFAGDTTKACVAGWVDVLGEHHDVFLYLTEMNKAGSAHDEAAHVEGLYKSHLWNN